jgi:ribosomal protein S1
MAVSPPEDSRGRDASDVMHQMLTRRLGAEVDYIVKAVDPKYHVAVGNRLEAMMAKRSLYYTRNRDGNRRVRAGACAEARVVSVIRPGIFVDIFGVETFVPLAELSYQRMMDATTAFQPGQRVLVRILRIQGQRPSEITVEASVKQAGENPYEKAVRKYSVGNRYVGTVSMVNTTGVFVALDGGIDCLCNYPRRGRPPRGARATVKILGISQDTNRIWGVITHIALPQ